MATHVYIYKKQNKKDADRIFDIGPVTEEDKKSSEYNTKNLL